MLGAASVCAALSCQKEADRPEDGPDDNFSPAAGETWHFTASFERPLSPGTKVAGMADMAEQIWDALQYVLEPADA